MSSGRAGCLKKREPLKADVERDVDEEEFVKMGRSGKYTLYIKVVLWWKRAMPRRGRRKPGRSCRACLVN